jgi:hypothetical protein
VADAGLEIKSASILNKIDELFFSFGNQSVGVKVKD